MTINNSGLSQQNRSPFLQLALTCGRVLLLAVCFLDGGCASTQSPPPKPSTPQAETTPSSPKADERNSYYSILYKLASQEADVDKLLVIKGERKEITALIKEIAKAYKQLKEELEEFASDDASLRLKETLLPTSEQKVRDSIDSTMTKELLLSKGEAFETELLDSQVDSLRYAKHLAMQIEKADTNRRRVSYMKRMSLQFDQLYKTSLAHLSVK